MTFLSPRNWFKPAQRQAKVCRRFSRIPRSIRPRLEQLEDRVTPTVFTANPTALDGAPGSLRDAINQVNADNGTATDTIQLSAGTYMLTSPNNGNNHEENNSQGDLNIGNDVLPVVIQGATDANGNPTSIIDQTVADRVLEINNPGSNVTIKNVVLEGGNAQENGGLGFEGQSDALGGGILNLGGNVVLSNVVVRSNKATAGNNFSAQGGGIYSQDGSLTINHSVILNNTATDGGEDATYGGGVAFALPNNTTPQLTITNSTVANNTVVVQTANGVSPASGSGGGIAAQGNSKIVNSTIAGNTATNQGGGMFFEAGATGQLTNDTVSGNTANEGGGLDNNNGDVQTVTLVNTIVAGNTITNNTGVPDQDITAQFTSDGHNLIGIGNTWVNNGGGPGDLAGTAANPLNANLGPLQNNGGTTLTMGLLPGSPAIGKGDPGVLSITGQNDQRGPGFARQDNGVVDIGAYQFTQPTTGGGGGGGGSNGGGGGGTTQSPPSLFGAIFTLFLDGVYLEIDILEGGSLDLAPSPSASSANFFLEALDVFLGDPSNAALQDSINFNMPYAGPFGQFALLLGEIELMQAVPPQSL